MTYTEALEARKRERAAHAQPVLAKKAEEEAADPVNKTNVGIGAGAGALTGLGTAAGVYGLAGLFPSLRKRRLLRALIATAAGGVAGTAAGIYTTKGMNDGSLPKAVGNAADRATKVYDEKLAPFMQTIAGRFRGAYDAAKNKAAEVAAKKNTPADSKAQEES